MWFCGVSASPRVSHIAPDTLTLPLACLNALVLPAAICLFNCLALPTFALNAREASVRYSINDSNNLTNKSRSLLNIDLRFFFSCSRLTTDIIIDDECDSIETDSILGDTMAYISSASLFNVKPLSSNPFIVILKSVEVFISFISELNSLSYDTTGLISV